MGDHDRRVVYGGGRGRIHRCAWLAGDNGTTLRFATGIKELVVNETPTQLKAWVSTTDENGHLSLTEPERQLLEAGSTPLA